MSGIIGGAGSKSGVIGETELDYEEGIWTPAFSSTGMSTTGGSPAGFYTKIGKQVFISFWLDITDRSGTLTNPLSIVTLPYTSKSATNYYGSITVQYAYNWDGDALTGGWINLRLEAGVQRLDFIKIVNNSATVSVTGASLKSAVSVRIVGGGHYMID